MSVAVVKRKPPKAVARGHHVDRQVAEQVGYEKEWDKLRAENFADQVDRESKGKKARHSPLPAPIADEPTAWQETPEGQIAAIDVDALVRHPDNRVPTVEQVAELAADMAVEGQLEPVEAWEAPGLPPGKLQILSGETRWAVAKKLKWNTIQARLITGIDAAKALELVAKYNSQRRDLNPIEKAKLIVRLCEPVEMGGGGFTREQAAARVGTSSGHRASGEKPSAAWASQHVGLLDLPAKWQERVASGELPWSWAREMTAVIVLPPVDAMLEEEWKHKGKPRESYPQGPFDSRNRLINFIEHVIDCDCRRLDQKYWVGNRHTTIGVDATNPAIRKQLGIVDVTLPDGRGKSAIVPIATNRQAFDEVLRKQQERAETKQAAKAGRDDQPAGRKDSPAAEKARAKQKAEQLSARIAAWRHDWLKALIARELIELPVALKPLRERLLIAIALHVIQPGIIQWADVRQQLRLDWGRLRALGDGDALWDAGTNLVRAIVECTDRDPKYPLIAHGKMDQIAAEAGIDLATEWNVVQEAWRALGDSRDDGQREASRFERFFLLFQTDQLDGLGTELGVHVAHVSGKAAKLKLLLGRDRNLPLPKAIKPLAGARRPSKSKGSKRARGK